MYDSFSIIVFLGQAQSMMLCYFFGVYIVIFWSIPVLMNTGLGGDDAEDWLLELLSYNRQALYKTLWLYILYM